MEKILKPYTIIPPHLYVKRSADRQLRDIISDMGRPGYVLVSRQMGKTNLLLNAKRELGNENDKFIYVDLSNTFDNEQSCFQNIIDLALETNEDSYFEASQKIIAGRKSLIEIPPHKQHTNELRILLKNTKGKLVIILDEIDALTKTQYSDKIFAQIRSVYFSRVNFPEFERLTYILSGVVEPSEIIKDPKISPFNIGEKIFLNDFSKEEFIDFVNRAKINLESEVLIERIFYWTNGNPRMTWDLCSEIENIQSNIKTKEQIDEIVKKLYLTAFDKPPIDNIREMVIADKSIRDAIVEIDYNKGCEVADNIKSKLYLAGIINYEENDIKIKNRIIKNSLNRAWLESVKEQEQGLLKIAIELLENEKYADAISCYEKYMTTNSFPDKETESFVYYHLGLALSKIFQYEKAIEFLSKSSFSISDYPKLFFKNKSITGLCYYYLGDFEKSIECFKFIIDKSVKDELYCRTLLNFGSACIKLKNVNYSEAAISIFNKLIVEENFDKSLVSEIVIDELKAISNYNLGLLYNTNKLVDSSFYFEKALETKIVEIKPIFYLNLINSKIELSNQLIEELIALIIANRLLPIDKDDPERPLLFNIDNFEEIIVIAFQNSNVNFEKILNYAKINVYSNKKTLEILYDFAIKCLNSNIWDTGVEFLKYSYSKFSQELILNETIYHYNTLRFLSYIIGEKENIKYSIEFLDCFQSKRHTSIDNMDFKIVIQTIIELSQNNEILLADKYLNLFYNLKSEVNNDYQINFILLKYLDFQIKKSVGYKNEAKSIAQEILFEIGNKKTKNINIDLFGEKGIENIKDDVFKYLNPSLNSFPKQSEKQFGRNDKIKVRYNDGRIVEDKFKKLEKDINGKLCSLI